MSSLSAIGSTSTVMIPSQLARREAAVDSCNWMDCSWCHGSPRGLGARHDRPSTTVCHRMRVFAPVFDGCARRALTAMAAMADSRVRATCAPKVVLRETCHVHDHTPVTPVTRFFLVPSASCVLGFFASTVPTGTAAAGRQALMQPSPRGGVEASAHTAPSR